MAKIGNMYLGGNDPDISQKSICWSGIAYRLKNEANIDQIWNSEDSIWQVEIKNNHVWVIARSIQIFVYDDILALGLEQINRCLDILCVKNKKIYELDHPEKDYICLFQDKGKSIVNCFSVASLGLESTISVTVRDKNGDVQPSKPIPEIPWTHGFRYYRLSQSSQDIFEAYRNLYLSLESLLNVIHPKQGGEERWIRDTLGIVKLKINLSKYTIPPEDAIDYFIRTQYKGIRCRLFHAKHPYALLPHEELNPVDVLNAYELLISLWHEIAEAFFQLPRGGSGFTYQGFKWLADNLFAKSFYLVFSNDATPPNKDDTITTLSNINDVVFDKSSYDGQVKPDVFRWQATKYLDNSININYVFKICTIVDSKLFNIAYIPNGLSLHGVDTFNTQQNLRFVNKGQPKTTF